MQVASYNYNIFHTKPLYHQPFEGAKDINLRYVLQHRSHLLPERMISNIEAILCTKAPKETLPTLREVHLNTYKGLLNCANFDEVRVRFPEFADISDAAILSSSNSSTVGAIKEKMQLSDFTLKLVQDVWGRLKTFNEICAETGISDRRMLQWLNSKINFINMDKNYRTLLKASEPELNKEIASKTRAYNQFHPDLVMKRNERAAESHKTERYRESHRQKMIKYYEEHPEKRLEKSEFLKKLWKKIPQVRKAISNAMASEKDYNRYIAHKDWSGSQLTGFEKRAKASFYKRFWKEHPDMLKDYTQAYHETAQEIKINKT